MTPTRPDFVVAIDGNAGAGKSTTAKGVANRLKFFYLDTGAMYRAFTLKYLNKGGTGEVDLKVIKDLLTATTIELVRDKGELRVMLDDQDVSHEIRSPRVSELVSQISALKEVRKWMVKKQQMIARGKNIVCEGRDMATVVFPHAQVKIFMDADLRIRAQRRKKELTEKNLSADLDEIAGNLKFRDNFDSSREHSPLKKADDAVVIDTTNLTIEEEIAIVEKIVRERMAKSKKYR